MNYLKHFLLYYTASASSLQLEVAVPSSSHFLQYSYTGFLAAIDKKLPFGLSIVLYAMSDSTLPGQVSCRSELIFNLHIIRFDS